MIDLDDYPVLTQNSEEFLNRRQLLDYRSERKECLRWLLTFGKKPDEAIGYAAGTVQPRSYRMDRFYRFVWEQEGGYTVNLNHDHADAWMTAYTAYYNHHRSHQALDNQPPVEALKQGGSV